MSVFDTVAKNLEANGYTVKIVDTAQAAADYLNEAIDGATVGIGGSKTIEALDVYDRLSEHNEVFWHWKSEDVEGTRQKAMTTDVYLCSANALAETGVIINVDGVGNRLAGTLYGHKKMIFVIGRNKLAEDEAAAITRCRQVACPKRINDFDVKTPCVMDGSGGTKCYDCKSPDRGCCGMVILWRVMESMDYEVVLVDEDLGY